MIPAATIDASTSKDKTNRSFLTTDAVLARFAWGTITSSLEVSWSDTKDSMLVRIKAHPLSATLVPTNTELRRGH